MFVFQSVIAWSLTAAARGVHPALAYDGSNFGSSELHLQEVAGHRMVARIAVLELRGDWPAFVDELGLRTWAHNQHACFLCRCPRFMLQDLEGYTSSSGPHELWTQADHDATIAMNKKVGVRTFRGGIDSLVGGGWGGTTNI